MKLSQNLKPESFTVRVNFRLLRNYRNSELHVWFLQWSVRRNRIKSLRFLCCVTPFSYQNFSTFLVLHLYCNNDNFNSHLSKTQSRQSPPGWQDLSCETYCPTGLEYNAYTLIFYDCFLISILYFSSLYSKTRKGITREHCWTCVVERTENCDGRNPNPETCVFCSSFYCNPREKVLPS